MPCPFRVYACICGITRSSWTSNNYVYIYRKKQATFSMPSNPILITGMRLIHSFTSPISLRPSSCLKIFAAPSTVKAFTPASAGHSASLAVGWKAECCGWRHSQSMKTRKTKKRMVISHVNYGWYAHCDHMMWIQNVSSLEVWLWLMLESKADLNKELLVM